MNMAEAAVTVRLMSKLTSIPSGFRSTILLCPHFLTTANDCRRHIAFRLPSQFISVSEAPCIRINSSRMAKSVDRSWGMNRRSCTTNGHSKSPDPVTVKPIGGSTTSTVGTTNATPQITNDLGSMTIWQRFLAPKPMPERYSALWYREIFLICTVFAITGSSTMLIVRPAVSDGLGIKGNLIDGPWSYRICSVVIMTPIYATLLVGIGTIFGRHTYFRHFSVKIFSRFGIPPELMDPTFHQTKSTFRKW